jgi:ribonuclease HII
MTAIISKALRDELMASAKAKLPEAKRTLVEMYTAHAKRAAKRLRRTFTDEDRARIVAQVDRQLKLG